MKLIRKLAWALCLVGSLTASLTNAQDPTSIIAGQVYNTVNLTNNTTTATDTTGTWQNIGLWNQGLPCWGPGGPVYCGPLPYFNNGSFNFSYGTADAYQIINLSRAVPNTSGIQVNGFNFGFTAKNGNGWDNGMLDYLKAYVSVYDSKGTVASYDYSNYTNTVYNWTTFNFSETFTKAYTPTGSSAIRYGFVGRDNNFWAGPYGPEIYNISFSLKYSVDPCVTNPLSSSSCPGFKEAMAKLNPQQTTSTTSYSLGDPAALTTSTAMADPTKNDVTSSNAGGVQISTTGEITPIVNVPRFVRSANDLGEAVKEKDKPKAIVKPPVLAAPTAPTQRRQEAVVDMAKIAAPEFGVQATEKQDSVVTVKTPQQDFVQQQARATATATVSTRRTTGNNYGTGEDNTDTSTSGTKSGSQFSLSLGRGQGLQLNEMQPQQRQSMMSVTNPLNGYLTMVPIENQPDQKSTVKRDVQNNELAGGVDLTKMAVQPVGFNDYLNLALTDSAFYGPKEVYQNQRVVDNARAQRLLSGASDRLYQELVNSQYKGQ